MLVEPLACALHAARDRRHPARRERRDHRRRDDRPAHARRRARGRAQRDADRVAKHAGQQTAARRFGADDVCAPERIYIEGARITHSRRLVGHQNRELLLGGFDRVLDCVGTGASIEQAITITRPRGRVILVGMPGELKADLAAAWLRELELRGAYGYEHDFPRALEFAETLKPGRLIDRGWPLRAFKKAHRARPESRAQRAASKTVFEIAA